MSIGRDSRICCANTRSGYGCIGLGKSPPLSSGITKAGTPDQSPDGIKDKDGRCGQCVPPSKNLQAETNMDYRNDCVDWFSFGGLENRYGSCFGVYVDFISYVILRKFALFS